MIVNNLIGAVDAALSAEILSVQALKANIEKDILNATNIIHNLNPQTIIILGSGKSGYVAARFAASMRSIGFNAHFLHSGELLHGDVGALNKTSVVIFFSNSGNTAELVKAMEIACNKEIPTIAFLGNENSALGDAADCVINLSCSTKMEYSNFLPTASITAATAAANCLLVALAFEFKKNANDFAQNHPDGSLGGFLSLPIKEVMTPLSQVALFDVESSISFIAKEMTKFPKGVALMVDSEMSLLGLLTDGDMRRILSKYTGIELSKITVENLMTSNPTVIDLSESIATALSTMTSNQPKRVSVLPVTNESAVVGIVTLNDIEARRFKNA